MKLLQIYFVTVSCLILGSYLLFGSGFHEWYVFALSAISIAHMALFDFVARKAFPKRGLFCISSLFLISFAIVFFQYPLLAPFYYEIRYNSLLWMREEFVNWTTMISAGSIHLFMAGYIGGFYKFTTGPKLVKVASASRQKIRVLLFIFPIVAISCFGLFLATVGESYLGGAYGGSANWGGGASYFFRLFEVFFYLTIALEVYKIKLINPRASLTQYILSFNIHTGAFIAFFLLFHIYTGDRGPIISTVLILVGGYDFYFKRLPYFISLAAVVAAAFSLSFISAYRTKDTSLTLEERIQTGKREQKDKKFYEITGDLAASVRIMNYAVMMTDEPSDFYWGWVQAGRVATMVPFAAGILNRAVPLRVNGAPLGTTSSSIFTYAVLGPNSNIGVGSSILADLYIDFWIFGCFIGMLLFGYFIAWTEVRGSISVGVFQVVFYLLVVSGAVYWARSFIGVNFQQWFLAMIVLYVIHKYFLGNRMRGVPRHPERHA